MMTHFWKDTTGAILSAELIFILTILVIGMIVGQSELQTSINEELDDIGNAIGHLNQSYYYSGFSAYKHTSGGLKSRTSGSAFFDLADACDNGCGGRSTIACAGAQPEGGGCGIGTGSSISVGSGRVISGSSAPSPAIRQAPVIRAPAVIVSEPTCDAVIPSARPVTVPNTAPSVIEPAPCASGDISPPSEIHAPVLNSLPASPGITVDSNVLLDSDCAIPTQTP